MEHVYTPYTHEEAIAAFHAKAQPWTPESNTWLTMGITEQSSGEKLGSIGLKIVNRQANIAEVGFMIKQSAQGRGFAGEALSLVKDYAFTQLGYQDST